MKALLLSLALATLAGCQTANPRIDEHASEFARLDPATQQSIRRGTIRPGFTRTMVYMALGQPAETKAGAGETIWIYHQHPLTASNETIRAGYRSRVVYDPVKRSEDVVTEPIDPKAFPNLVPHTLRLTFRNDRLVSIDRTPGA